MGLSDNSVRRITRSWPLAAALLHPLTAALLAGVALRALLWGGLPRLGLISDEGEYLSAATWLAQGRGFAWYQGYLWTRAPLYPLLVAAHLRLFGAGPEPVYLTQTLLSLLNAALVYTLARRLLGPAPGRAAPALAALLMALYFPLATYAQVLLSETLFISLVLGAFLALAGARPGHLRPALLAGALLGLAALTRSLALGFVPVLGGAMLVWAWAARGEARRASGRSALALLLAAALVVGPWTLYNSRLYGGPVLVDTSGAFNLLLGGRTAFEGEREDAHVRNFVLGVLGQEPASDPAARACAPYPGPLPSQAARQAAMTREGLCLIAARPAAFAGKSLAELVDLFQINYTGAERFAGGFTTGRLPTWYVLGLFALDDTLYVLTLPLAVLGYALARRRLAASPAAARLQSAMGLWWAYNLAAAPLLFAINRFRLPLLPFAFIFAAFALTEAARALARTGAASPAAPARHAIPARAWYAACGLLAALLWLVAATPHAYLEPRRPGADSRWASYLGPYPSSLEITRIALAARPRAAGDARFAAALQAGDAPAARAALQAGPVSDLVSRLGPALVAARERQPAQTMAALPPPQAIHRARDVRSAVLLADALRAQGDEDGARAVFTRRYVDDANPAAWAWEWLRPPPAARVDLGGNLDLGYFDGCYLGEGDAAERATYRWCTDGARLRFPGAGTGRPQTLVLRADGRGWPVDMRPAPPVQVLLGQAPAGAFTPGADAPGEYQVALPPTPPGADVVVTLRAATFVPGPEHYLRQQSEESVGQVQRLGVRLDWAELRP